MIGTVVIAARRKQYLTEFGMSQWRMVSPIEAFAGSWPKSRQLLLRAFAGSPYQAWHAVKSGMSLRGVLCYRSA